MKAKDGDGEGDDKPNRISLDNAKSEDVIVRPECIQGGRERDNVVGKGHAT